MHKFWLPITLLVFANCYAENIYLEPQYTVAVEKIKNESATSSFYLKTITPIVYKNNYLPSGLSLKVICSGNEGLITQIESTVTEIPIALGDTIKQRVTCSPQVMPNLIWTPVDDYKLKKIAFKPIIESDFQAVSFNMSNTGNGSIKMIKSDGYLTQIVADKQSKYNDANFFAKINNIAYYVQSTVHDNVFTLHAANMQQLFIISKSGKILADIEFPSYE